MNIKKSVLSLALAAVACAGLTACSNLANNAKKTEYGLAQLADGTMKDWAVYYKQATNDPAYFHETREQIEQQHVAVNRTARRSAASLRTLDTFIASYQTNSATKTALLSSIAASSAVVPELVSLVAEITGKTNLSTFAP